MPNTQDNTLSARRAFLEAGGWLVLLGSLNLATRSVARVWVDSARNRWVIPYNGELLLWTGCLFAAAGAALIAFSYQRLSARPLDVSALRASVLLFCASALGFAASGVAQAWMHYCRLAIPGGWTHPRSLVALSAAAAILGAAVFFAPPGRRAAR